MFIKAVYGPGPIVVNALILMKYVTYASSSVRFVVRVGAATVMFCVCGIESCVNCLYCTSYSVMIPFCSISGTSCHISSIAVELIFISSRLMGGAVGTEEKEACLM